MILEQYLETPKHVFAIFCTIRLKNSLQDLVFDHFRTFKKKWEKIRKLKKQYDQKMLKCWTLNDKRACYEKPTTFVLIRDNISEQKMVQSFRVASSRAG